MSNAWNYAAGGTETLALPLAANISPADGLIASSVDVTITGANFIQGRTVITIAGTGVTVGQVIVTNATLIDGSLYQS